MSNPTISQITLPSGTTYDIKDAVARGQVAGAIVLRGETSTELADNDTTNPITINNESFTAAMNDAVFYQNKEFIFDGTNWHEFGDMTGLGALAVKDSASASYTPAGSIAVNAASGSGTSYTPEGSVSAPTISVASAGSTASITPFGSAGSLPSLSMNVSNETLTISFSPGSLPSAGTAVTVKTGDASYESSTPIFTGTEKKLAFSGTQATITAS